MQSCLALRFLVKRENDGARGRLMNIYFLSNIGPRLACMRTSRKTSARLKITFVDMTYPKGWTGSLPLCPLIFSCLTIIWPQRRGKPFYTFHEKIILVQWKTELTERLNFRLTCNHCSCCPRDEICQNTGDHVVNNVSKKSHRNQWITQSINLLSVSFLFFRFQTGFHGTNFIFSS